MAYVSFGIFQARKARKSAHEPWLRGTVIPNKSQMRYPFTSHGARGYSCTPRWRMCEQRQFNESSTYENERSSTYENERREALRRLWGRNRRQRSVVKEMRQKFLISAFADRKSPAPMQKPTRTSSSRGLTCLCGEKFSSYVRT